MGFLKRLHALRTMAQSGFATGLCIASFMERADEYAFPAMFPKIRQAFNATPFQLGALPATRGPVQSLVAIFGGYLSHTFNRKYTIAGADFLCALFTMLTALVGKFDNLYGYMVGEGVGMAILTASSYSLIVDMASKDFVGVAFGAQYSVGVSGLGVAALVGLALGNATMGGLTGWRLFLGIVSVIAMLCGFLTLFTTVDPRFEGKEFELVCRTNKRNYGSLLKSFFTTPAMAGIIAQGILMHFPFNCFVFMSLFYEAIGFGAWRIGFIVFVFWMGSAVGGWFAGWLGGYAAKNHGGGIARIAVAQLGYLLSVIVTCILFLEERNCAYGVEWALEAVFGAFTPMYMGKIIETAGYLDPDLHPGPETLEHNAKVTGRTMAMLVGAFWGAGIVVLSYLYYAYPRALIRVEAARLEEEQGRHAAMQRISPDPMEKLRTDSASVYTPLVKFYEKMSVSTTNDSPRSDLSNGKDTKITAL